MNIKILLADPVESGKLNARQRVELLEAMTAEVAALVLRDNHQQSLAISLDQMGGVSDMPAQNALMHLLEAQGVLDRAVAGLPDATLMNTRAAAGQALTRPELCTLMAHMKLHLAAVLDASALPDDPALAALVVRYFPQPLRERFSAEINRHQLRRELTGTRLANELVNRLGVAGFGRLAGESGAALVEVAHAALMAEEAYGLQGVYAQMENLPQVPAAARYAVLLAASRLQEEAARVLLGGARPLPNIDDGVADMRAPLAALLQAACARVAGVPAVVELVRLGIPEPLAAFAAAVPELVAGPLVWRLAKMHAVPMEAAQEAWLQAGDWSAIDTLRAAAGMIKPHGVWEARAVTMIGDDLTQLQATLVSETLKKPAGGEGLLANQPAGVTAAVERAREAAMIPEIVSLSVAVRQLCKSFAFAP